MASVTHLLVSELVSFPVDSAALSDMDKGIGGGLSGQEKFQGPISPEARAGRMWIDAKETDL